MTVVVAGMSWLRGLAAGGRRGEDRAPRSGRSKTAGYPDTEWYASVERGGSGRRGWGGGRLRRWVGACARVEREREGGCRRARGPRFRRCRRGRGRRWCAGGGRAGGGRSVAGAQVAPPVSSTPQAAPTPAPTTPTVPAAAPSAVVEVFGRSVRGRPLRARVLGDPAAPHRVLVVGWCTQRARRPGGDEGAAARGSGRRHGWWVVDTLNPDRCLGRRRTRAMRAASISIATRLTAGAPWIRRAASSTRGVGRRPSLRPARCLASCAASTRTSRCGSTNTPPSSTRRPATAA